MDECTDGWMDGQIDRHTHLVGSVSLENPNTLNYQRTMEAFPEEAGWNYTTLCCLSSVFFFFFNLATYHPEFQMHMCSCTYPLELLI